MHKDAVFDPDQLLQHCLALRDVGKLDHERRLPVGAIGNQRIVGLEFLVDAIRLEDLFDAQHLLDLVLHGQAILEVQRCVCAEIEPAIFLVLEHFPAKLWTGLGILLEAE